MLHTRRTQKDTRSPKPLQNCSVAPVFLLKTPAKVLVDPVLHLAGVPGRIFFIIFFNIARLFFRNFPQVLMDDDGEVCHI